MFAQRFVHALEKCQQQGLYRQRRVLEDDDPHVISFCHNDYLALRRDPRIQRAYQRGFENYPVGSGGSMVVSGYHAIHRTVEKTFAEALHVDDGLLFSSGYAANLSIMALLNEYAIPVVMDRGVHASFYAGLKTGSSHRWRYRHNDVEDCQRQLTKPQQACVLLTESLFSMSVQRAPLPALSALLPGGEHQMIIDEAHAFGVLGPQGLGAVMQAGLCPQQVPLRVLPLGKAFAASGALIVGQAVWIDALLQVAKPYIYSTGMSPAYAYGLLETFDVVRASDDRRAHLDALIAYFRAKVQTSPLTFRDSSTAIQQLQLGCPHRAMAYAQSLNRHDIRCMPMRQPTVSAQETGLRIILNADHQTQDLDRLFQCLQEVEQA